MDGEPSAKRTKVDDDEVHQALQSIEENQKVLEELNKEAAEEMIKIEQIYSKKRQPVFNQRSECIAKVPKFWLKVVSFANTLYFSNFLLTFYLVLHDRKSGYNKVYDVGEAIVSVQLLH